MPYGDAGWVHYLPPNAAKPVPVSRRKDKVYLTVDQVKEYLGPCYQWRLGRPAQALKLSKYALEYMQTGYDVDKAALVFPMFNAKGDPVGCRLRRRDGRKWSLKGGREGVFRSQGFYPLDPVFIAEGPTDAAALIDAGIYNVLGRPSCSGGSSIIKSMLSSHPRTPVVVLSDPDEPGIAGAERLMMGLRNPCIVLTGPSDIRDYVIGFPDRAEAGESIMEVLSGCRTTDWDTVAKNTPGECFDFSSIGKVMV